jgi:dynein heavy chain
VQPHLKKCFEGIQRLKIEEDKKIKGMFSAEGEYVAFNTIVDTVISKGNVDEWLLKVEASMVEAVRKTVNTAHEEYKSMTRCEWALGRCGMAVLNQDMTYWTMDAEDAIIQNQLEKFMNSCETNLQDIVCLVRTPIAALDRCTLEALIVLNVHNRDVVRSLA